MILKNENLIEKEKMNHNLTDMSENTDSGSAERRSHRRTAADPGWRERRTARRTTVESGWRDEQTPRRTTVDPGWREEQAPRRTTVDPGWREEQAPRRTTVDPGWREEQAPRRTTVDPGWREEQAPRRTTVDPGWRDGKTQTAARSGSNNHNDDLFYNSTKALLGTVSGCENKSREDFKADISKVDKLISINKNEYKYKKILSEEGGESLIILCAANDGNNVVAKVYTHSYEGKEKDIEARIKVLDYMRSDEGKKYTLAVTDFGVLQVGGARLFFEIMPYCERGDLSGDNHFSFDDIVDITGQLNEILRSIHSNGIIHRDIKPENLYITPEGIKLGDFGIAKYTVNGSHITEYFLFSEGYAAPEMKRYFVIDKSDYYALGVTLASLFEGHFVFENMEFETEALILESEKLPLMRKDTHKEELENLLNGLCRIDYKVRFGYEDVKRWLENHNYQGSSGEEWPRPMKMFNESLYDEKSVFDAVTKTPERWDETKSRLYQKHIEQFFAPFNSDYARAAQLCEEKYRSSDSDKGLFVFLKRMYPAGPIAWKGLVFEGLSELASAMLEADDITIYAEMLEKNLISFWLSNTEGISFDENTKNLVEQIEAYSADNALTACKWFGYSFVPKKTISVCEKEASDIGGLIKALFSDPKKFYFGDGYSKLIDIAEGYDLYAFLFSFGYKEYIEKVLLEAEKCDEYNKASLIFAMMETIAEKSSSDKKTVLDFYLNYGPMGISRIVKKIIERDEKNKGNEEELTYYTFGKSGKKVIDTIKNFESVSAADVSDAQRKYQKLDRAVNDLRETIHDNPFVAESGLYPESGIICRDLYGCFAFEIFGVTAPLAFNAYIQKSGEVKK